MRLQSDSVKLKKYVIKINRPMELLDSYAQTLPPAFRAHYADLKAIQEIPKRPFTRSEDAWESIAMSHIHMIDGNIDVWAGLISPAIWFFAKHNTELTGTRRWAFDHIMKAHQSSLAAVITMCKWPEVARDPEPVKKKAAAGRGRPQKVLTLLDEVFSDV